MSARTGRRRVALATAAMALAAGLVAGTPCSSAQSGPRTANAPLGRVFYGPHERHELDVAEATALADAEFSGKSPIAAAVRFNGWLTGPGPTRAWVNGKAHLASEHGGALLPAARQAPGSLPQQDTAPAAASAVNDQPVPSAAGEGARFDASNQQLVVVGPGGAERRLRAGQSDDQEPLLPLAGSGAPAPSAEPRL